MKIYKVFTSASTEEFARLQCQLHKPFLSGRVGWMGTYQERAWWFEEPGGSWPDGEVRCVDVEEPEMVISFIERGIVCGGDVGDLMVWSYVDGDGPSYSWVKFLGMGVRVSVGCYRLPWSGEERTHKGIMSDREVYRR